MTYSRVLAVVALMATVALAAIFLPRPSQAVTHGPRTAPPPSLQRALQQAAGMLVAAQRHAVPQPPWVITPQLGQPLRPPLNGGTCFIAASCSISPCVVPVANAVVPTLGNTATGCPLGDRVPKTFRISLR